MSAVRYLMGSVYPHAFGHRYLLYAFSMLRWSAKSQGWQNLFPSVPEVLPVQGLSAVVDSSENGLLSWIRSGCYSRISFISFRNLQYFRRVTGFVFISGYPNRMYSLVPVVVSLAPGTVKF